MFGSVSVWKAQNTNVSYVWMSSCGYWSKSVSTSIYSIKSMLRFQDQVENVCTVSCGLSKCNQNPNVKPQARIFFQILTKDFQVYDSCVTWLQIIWGWFQKFQMALIFSKKLLLFCRARQTLEVDAASTTVYFSCVTQAVSKCKKM